MGIGLAGLLKCLTRQFERSYSHHQAGGDSVLQEYFTLAEIARQLNLPESTARYYKNKFSTYIQSYGNGRKKRYGEEAIEALRLIAEMYNRNANATEIEDALSREFAVNIDIVNQSDRNTTTTQQLREMTALLELSVQAIKDVAQVKEELLEVKEQLAKQQEYQEQCLDERDRRLTEIMRKMLDDRQQKSFWHRIFKK